MSKQVGALWPVKETQNKDFIYSGSIDTLNGEVKIGVFKNTSKKEGDKQPEFHIVRLEDRE